MSQTYFAILTAIGEAKLANAISFGNQLQVSRMAVGDGNGALPVPIRTQTALVHETYRADLNSLMVDPVNASQIIAELVIPDIEGGYWLREMGLYDAAGDLIAVANCPPSYKPVLGEGSGRTQVMRMVLVVASTTAIQLKIDPSVVLATREYVDTAVLESIAKMDFKHSVLVATTANIVLSGIQTVDGELLTVGARVLVKDQAQAKENGIYVVPAAGAWKRAQDADTSVEVTPGLFVSVEKGAINGDSVWQLVTDSPIVLGTTALAFEMVAGRTGISAGAYTNLTVDKYGRVIAGTNPDTLSGHGITDAFTKTQTAALVEAALGSSVISNTHKKLFVSATGTSALVSLKAEKLLIGKDSLVRLANRVELTLNMATTGLGGLDTGVVSASSCYGVWAATNGENTAAIAALMPVLQGSATLGSPIVTGLPSTALMRVGMQFSSAVFPWGVTIKSIDSSSQITATQPALATVAADNLRFVYEPVLPAGYVASRFSSFFTDSSASKFPLSYTQLNRYVRLRPSAGTNVLTLPVMVSGVQGNPSQPPTFVPVAVGAFLPPTALKIALTLYGYLSNSSLVVAPNPGHYGLSTTPTASSPLHLSQGASAGATHVSVSGEIVPERGYLYFASNSATSGLGFGGWEDDV